jgi:hypothetical protein
MLGIRCVSRAELGFWSVSVLCDDSNRIKAFPRRISRAKMAIPSAIALAKMSSSRTYPALSSFFLAKCKSSWSSAYYHYNSDEWVLANRIDIQPFLLHILLIIYTALDWRSPIMFLNHAMWLGGFNKPIEIIGT